MTDQEKAINEVLESIEIEILKLMQQDAPEENGYHQALRLCRASLRARYIDFEETHDE